MTGRDLRHHRQWRIFLAVANATPNQTNPAVLGVRLLALLERIPSRAGKKDVHLLRTTVRRLEVQLEKCPSKVAKALKRIRKRAGRVRDTDVHLGLLDDAPESHVASTDPAAQDWKQLRKVLKKRRSKYLSSLRSTISDLAPLLRRRLPALAEAADGRELTAAEADQQTARAREHYLRWSRTVPSDPERLHRMRINTKKLRYALEPLEAFPESAELAARFKEVQDAIGTWHDWLTLQELAEKSLDASGVPSKPAAGLLGRGSNAVCVALRAHAGSEFHKAHRTAQDVRNWITARHEPEGRLLARTRPSTARRKPEGTQLVPISQPAGDSNGSIHRVS